MGKAAKTAMKKAKVVKTRALTKQRPRQCLDVESFRNRYFGLCKTATSLPYPMDGGRRADLAIQCGQWYLAAKFEGEAAAYKASVMKAGFLAIHASRKMKATRPAWGVLDKEALSWASQMTKRLQNLLRHCSQAALAEAGPPQWLRVIQAGQLKQEATDEAAETQIDPESQLVPKQEICDEEAPEDAEEEVAPEESEVEEAPEEAEEEAPEESEDEVAPAEWHVDYSHESSKAYRVKATDPQKRKQYTSTFEWVEGCTASDAVVARWEDGFTSKIAKLTCGQQWPQWFSETAAPPTRCLPKIGKQKKGKTTKGEATDHFWSGYGNTSQEYKYVKWRDSRGWMVVLMQSNSQLASIRPTSYTFEGADPPANAKEEACVKLMSEVGKTALLEDGTDLKALTLSLVEKYNLRSVKGKGAPKAKAAGQATPPASATACDGMTPRVRLSKKQCVVAATATEKK